MAHFSMHIFILLIVTNILQYRHCTLAYGSSLTSNIHNRYKHREQIYNQQAVPYYANQQRQLLSISSTVASDPKNKNSKSGLMKLMDKANKLYTLWIIIGVLVTAICCVSCCCLYYFNRTQSASRKIQKLSISKPSKINIIKPPNNGIRSPTCNTVNTFSSYATNATVSPAGLSVQSAQSDVSYNHIQLPSPNTRSKNFNPAHKIPSDCDQSVSADETVQRVVLTNTSTMTSAQEQSTIRSMDVDEIQLTPNASVRSEKQTQSGDESGNDYVGFVINYNNPGAQSWQRRPPIPIRSHSSSTPGAGPPYGNNINMNQNNNAMWNSNAPHRNTVAVMHSMGYPQNRQPPNRSPPNRSPPNISPPYAQNNNGAQHSSSRSPPNRSPPYAQNNNNNVKDRRFRFQPQYQYPPRPPPPPPPKQAHYNMNNMKMMRPQVNIAPPPVRKQFNMLQIVQDDPSEKEMTHITSSTIATLHTADFEDSNTDSASSSTKETEQTGNERQTTCTTDMTHLTAQMHAYKDTFASHTMYTSNTLDTAKETVVSYAVCDSDVFENEGKDVESVIFAVAPNVNEVDDGTYMKLQRNLKFLDTKSVFDVTLDCEPEHSPNNSIMSMENIKDISTNSAHSHTL